MLHLTQALRRFLMTVIFSILAITVSTGLRAQQSVDVSAADIGGVVASSKGPEAGVWVIAETTDLPTKFARIVVTDDQGRYLIPNLPTANYSVWVRGYGLVELACQEERRRFRLAPAHAAPASVHRGCAYSDGARSDTAQPHRRGRPGRPTHVAPDERGGQAQPLPVSRHNAWISARCRRRHYRTAACKNPAGRDWRHCADLTSLIDAYQIRAEGSRPDRLARRARGGLRSRKRRRRQQVSADRPAYAVARRAHTQRSGARLC